MTDEIILQERRRIVAILSSPQARGREWAARHFAFCTDLPADAVIAELAKIDAPWPARPRLVNKPS